MIKIKANYGISVAHGTLRQFYLDNHVHYLKSDYRYKGHSEKDIWLKQHSFVKKPAKLLQSDREVLFFDEASFHLWMYQRKCWMSSKERKITTVINP